MTSATATDTATDTTTEAIPELGIITAQGRHFVSRRKTTGRQDFYVAARLEAAGLERLTGELGAEGSMSELAVGIIKGAYENDTLYEILGALLTETDANGVPIPLTDSRGRPQKWTVEKAEEIASFVANLDDDDEKEKFNTIITAILILFFTTGANSLLTSQNSSEMAPAETQDSQDRTISIATPRPDGSSAANGSEALLKRLLEEGDLDPTITASGTTRSEKSPGTTPTS